MHFNLIYPVEQKFGQSHSKFVVCVSMFAVYLTYMIVDFFDERTQFTNVSKSTQTVDDVYKASSCVAKTQLHHISRTGSSIQALIDGPCELEPAEKKALRIRLDRLSRLKEERSLDAAGFAKQRLSWGVAFARSTASSRIHE
jgi:hypothetical protein